MEVTDKSYHEQVSIVRNIKMRGNNAEAITAIITWHSSILSICLIIRTKMCNCSEVCQWSEVSGSGSGDDSKDFVNIVKSKVPRWEWGHMGLFRLLWIKMTISWQNEHAEEIITSAVIGAVVFLTSILCSYILVAIIVFFTRLNEKLAVKRKKKKAKKPRGTMKSMVPMPLSILEDTYADSSQQQLPVLSRLASHRNSGLWATPPQHKLLCIRTTRTATTIPCQWTGESELKCSLWADKSTPLIIDWDQQWPTKSKCPPQKSYTVKVSAK